MKRNYEAQLPKARTAKLIIKEVDDEVLVYDLVNDKAHCLNRSAALVWKNCDGNKSVSEISLILAKETDAAVDESVIWLALDELEKFQLLESAPTKPAMLHGMNRRQLIRAAGIAAAALPIIISMSAPPAASAQSCLANGQTCSNGGQCCSGNCGHNPATPPGAPKQCGF